MDWRRIIFGCIGLLQFGCFYYENLVLDAESINLGIYYLSLIVFALLGFGTFVVLWFNRGSMKAATLFASAWACTLILCAVTGEAVADNAVTFWFSAALAASFTHMCWCLLRGAFGDAFAIRRPLPDSYAGARIADVF